MHAMSFYWSADIGDFFFKGLTITTAGPFSVLCIVLVLLSIVYEAMKVHSAKVRARAARERLRASSCAPSESANLLATDSSESRHRFFSRRLLKLLGEASIFLLHNTLGYALMLSVMIYNGYVFVMVVLGMGLGYFLFGHIAMRVNMENMQARTTKVVCSPVCPEDERIGSPSREPVPGQRDQLNTSAGPSSISSTTVLHHKPEIYHNYQATHCGDSATAMGSSTSSTGPIITDSCRL